MKKIKAEPTVMAGYKCPNCENEEITLKQSYCQICGEQLIRSDDSGNMTGQKNLSPYERTKRAVYATGNRWAIENFEATHN